MPLPLFEALEEVRGVVESVDHLLVFLDFDGTLAPIVARPELARLPDRTRTILERLAGREDCTVGIISGRALDDVQARVGIDGLIYAGNHGLEISGGGLHFGEPTAIRLKDEIREIVAVLSVGLERVAGALVESKGLTASIHYRQVEPENWGIIERTVRRAVPDDHPNLVLALGKRVWEVRPRVGWNKGSALKWIREQLGRRRATTFYLGDDRTDEDAFAEVGPLVTALVGPPQSTKAGFRVADTEEVAEFLGWLCGVGCSAGLR